MANALYGKGRNKFARGDIQWKAGGHTIRCFLVDSAAYTLLIDTDEFLDAIPVGARKGNAGGTARADAPRATLIDPVLGVCDANDIVFTAVPGGTQFEYLVLFRDDGVADASSPLIACIDTATGLPVTSSGGNIQVAWAETANKIFKL